ncbi:MAG TPA: DUF2147 domain-containing protein [Chitinophagaceae bacterium]
MYTLRKSMMQIGLLTVVLLSITGIASAQTDPIEGVWFNDKKDAKIHVFKKSDGKFYGQIIWLKDPLKNGKVKLDENNPKSDLQTQPIVGKIILKGCEKDGNTYDDGTIYDPENGKTYDCTLKLKGNILSLRGYVGISWFGRTTEWQRAN